MQQPQDSSPPGLSRALKRPAGSALRRTNQNARFAVAIRDIEQARRQGKLKGGESGRRDSIWACNFLLLFFASFLFLGGSGSEEMRVNDKMIMVMLQIKGIKRSSKGCRPFSVSRGAS